MLPISPEDKAALEQHLHQAASILKQYTEPDKLKDFERIEVELRTQMLTVVSPTVAEIFLTQRHPTPPECLASLRASSAKSKSAINKLGS
jgi:hypothetical protein